MWIVTRTPINYLPNNRERFCILDDQDGDVHDFYDTVEEAEEALMVLLGAK